MRADGDEQRFPADAIVVPDARPAGSAERELGDFALSSGSARLLVIAPLIGVGVTALALGLLELIGLIAHLVYTGGAGTSITEPDTSALGVWSVFVPVAGGLVVGAMAKLGSERIRGHGIPEAMETILLRGSRMEPRLAVLKPVSSAVSIGTGGPFGAEGPIIVTGGAVGSIVGQLMHLTAAERRCLLVGGAAAGMTAVFGTPLAAILLAVELLLFEWRPRSLVPVALAACAAELARERLVHAGLLHAAPLFPVGVHTAGGLGLAAGAVLVGATSGGLAWVMTKCVYGAEDAFGRLPLHWMWWPAAGGLVVGLGGLLEPRVLGVGYQTIGAELAGRLALGALVSVLLVKLVVWAVALGSNTSGGILAPLLMLGAALGGILGHLLPGADPGVWAVLGMAGAMAGVMRSPLTSIVFALELTHDVSVLLPLTIACTIAHLISVRFLKRSILTEKVARRGYHVSREYEVDPLHALLVKDVMRPAAVSAAARPRPVARADETLREVADRMILTGAPALDVLDPVGSQVLGAVGPLDLLKAHERVLVEERHRERPLRPGALMSPGRLRDEDYGRVLEFRTELRDFLRWSEEAAHEAGLTPSMHQLLLAVRGHSPAETGPTIGEVAEQLHMRHHSAVELAQRAASAGLLSRLRDERDHRRIRLQLTERGEVHLEALTRAHLPRIAALARSLGAVVVLGP